VAESFDLSAEIFAVKRTFPAPLTLKFGKKKCGEAPAQIQRGCHAEKSKFSSSPFTAPSMRVDATNQGEEKNPFPTSPTDLFSTVHVPLLIQLTSTHDTIVTQHSFLQLCIRSRILTLNTY